MIREPVALWSGNRIEAVPTMLEVVCRTGAYTEGPRHPSHIYPMSTFRTHTTLPEEVRQAAGAWKDKDHPELKAGSAAWAKELRRESETRFQRQLRNQ